MNKIYKVSIYDHAYSSKFMAKGDCSAKDTRRGKKLDPHRILFRGYKTLKWERGKECCYVMYPWLFSVYDIKFSYFCITFSEKLVRANYPLPSPNIQMYAVYSNAKFMWRFLWKCIISMIIFNYLPCFSISIITLIFMSSKEKKFHWTSSSQYKP